MTTAIKHPPAAKNRVSDAIALLTADHKKVKGLFNRFDELMGQADVDDEKAELVKQVCDELKIHAQVEEEIFYPAVHAAIDDDDLMDEADVEHAEARELIAQLEAMHPGDDLYDAKVVVLGEQIAHHIKEEEDDMFPQAKRAKLDTAVLGEQMLERKLELLAEMGLPNEDEATANNGGGSQPAKQKLLRDKATQRPIESRKAQHD